MKDRYGIYLLALLAIGLIFHFYMGLCGESETTGQRQAREAYEREQAAELEERLQEAYDEGYGAGQEAAREELGDLMRNAAEHLHNAEGMIDDFEVFTIDDVYGEILEAEDYLSDYY